MQIVSLASGSKGNATWVACDGVALLIDCGLSGRILRARLNEIGADPAALAGVLITHSHGDHTSGLKPLLGARPDLSLYANAMTAETIAADCAIDDASFVCFENGQPFRVGPFEVSAFPIPHDTSDPVGYLVRAGGETYFHATDIGTPLDSIGARLAEADYATLESNHDPVLLCESRRPAHVIRRIAGPRGHLSNDESAALVRRFATPRLRRLGLAHLSHDCNVPHRAEETMRQALAEGALAQVVLKVYEQDAVVRL